jgi:Flp pilus assembly pilin Flp
MRSVLYRFVRDGEGQDLIEYALLSGLLAIVCITGILELSRLIGFLESVGAFLDDAI